MKTLLQENTRNDILSITLILALALAFTLALKLTNQIPLDLTTQTHHGAALSLTYYQAYDFISTTTRSGDSIQWNPDDQMGVPFLANAKNRPYSPFTIPFYLLPTYTALLLSVFLKIATAGLTAYYTARKLGYTPILALICANAFQASHGLLAQPIEPIADALPWIPLLFLYTERLHLKQARYWPTGALTIALMLTSSDWIATLCAVLTMLAYLLLHQKIHPHQPGIKLPLLALTASTLTALLLTAIQWIPHLHYITQTLPPVGIPKNLPTLTQLPLLLFPNTGAPKHFGVLHIGTIQILTTTLWLTMRPSLFQHQRAKIDCLQIISITLITLTLLHGTLLKTSATALLTHHQLLLPWGFMTALATIITLSTWLELSPEQCKATSKRTALATPPLLLIIYTLTLNQQTLLTTTTLTITILTITTYYLLLTLTIIKPKTPWFPIILLTLNTLDLTNAAHQNGHRDTLQALKQTPQTPNPHKRTRPAIRQFQQELNKRPHLTNLTPQPHHTLQLTQNQVIPPPLRRTLKLQTTTPTGHTTYQNLTSTRELQIIQHYRSHQNPSPQDLDPNLPPIIQANHPTHPFPQSSPQPHYTNPTTNTTLTITLNPTTQSILHIQRHLNPDWTATTTKQSSTPRTTTRSTQQTPIPHFPINLIHTGIQLQPGPQQITLTYTPKHQTLAQTLTLLAAITTLLGYINLAYHRIHANYMRV